MTEPITVAMIAAIAAVVGGVVSPLISNWFSSRGQPSKSAVDRKILAEAGHIEAQKESLVSQNLRDEIERLDKELDDEREANDGLRGEVRRLTEEVAKRPTRDELIDANGKLRRQLIDLGEVPTNGAPK